jgi:two-component system response regulator NreC
MHPSRNGLPIRVVVADDHAMVRRTMRLLLDDERDIEVRGEAADLTAALRHVHLDAPHVLVLDLRLPNGSTIETIRHLRAESPNTQIVVLTMEDSPQFAQQALDAGALGFVLKDRADSELVAAVRSVARGGEYVSPRVSAALEALQRVTGTGELSPREIEIVRLIALGFTSREIADKLHLSRRTVETHRSRIHSKLGVTTRAELVRFALARHLVE